MVVTDQSLNNSIKKLKRSLEEVLEEVLEGVGFIFGRKRNCIESKTKKYRSFSYSEQNAILQRVVTGKVQAVWLTFLVIICFIQKKISKIKNFCYFAGLVITQKLQKHTEYTAMKFSIQKST